MHQPRASRTQEGASITGQYVHDAVGNLSQFIKPNVVQVDYAVDAVNRRISKKNNGLTDLKVSSVFTRALAALCGGLGGVSASSSPSNTISAGIGGGLYAGLTRSTTVVEGYNFTSGTLA